MTEPRQINQQKYMQRARGFKRAAESLPLQVVGSRGEINAIEGGAITTANQKQLGRSRQYLGTQDASEFRIAYAGFFVDAATSGNGQTAAELNASNDCPIRASVEIDGVVVQATFGGAAQGLIVAGTPLYMSDPILPAAFGLTKFAAGTLAWIKSEREFAVGQKGMFHQTASNNPVIDGERWAAAAVAATSQLATPGPIAVTGGWTAQAHIWHPYALIGRPLRKMMAVATFGASIENGVNDGQGDGLNGAGGYMRRMLGAQKNARIHLAKSGETARSFIANSAKRRVMLQYVNHILSGHGGNDYSTSRTLAELQADWLTLWGLLRAGAPAAHIEHYALSPKANSTDAYATVANQTPRIGFETGGAYRDPANAWCAAQVASNPNLDAFIDLSAAQVDAVALDKWRVDLGQPTTDGTHPNGVIAAAMAALGAPHIETLRKAYEEGISYQNIFAATAPLEGKVNDGEPNGINLGLRFKADKNGKVYGVRYFKPVGTTGVHTGSLWSDDSTIELARVTFANETASGWQEQLFANPVDIVANTKYIVAYHSASGDYVATVGSLAVEVVSADLRSIANNPENSAERNGLYRYGAIACPNAGSQNGAPNYWSDVLFVPN